MPTPPPLPDDASVSELVRLCITRTEAAVSASERAADAAESAVAITADLRGIAMSTANQVLAIRSDLNRLTRPAAPVDSLAKTGRYPRLGILALVLACATLSTTVSVGVVACEQHRAGR